MSYIKSSLITIVLIFMKALHLKYIEEYHLYFTCVLCKIVTLVHTLGFFFFKKKDKSTEKSGFLPYLFLRKE